jgi:hypothetical protein
VLDLIEDGAALFWLGDCFVLSERSMRVAEAA